ncbi:MAG: DUF1289 domain-containing protein [Nevskiales bacterium]
MTQEIESPCTGVCQLDAYQVCKGCFRTIGEIIAWPDADREIRLRILNTILQRKSGTTK